MATAMSTFVLLLGGKLIMTDRVLANLAGARIIAADGGMRHAASLGVVPELWVGDFDSSSEDLQAAWPQVAKQQFPASKDMTDGELAVDAARKMGATSLILMGALGGDRSDHAMAHLFLAVAWAERGLPVMLTSGDEEAWPLIAGAIELDLPKGSLFSVLGLTHLSGLSLRNARYPLQDVDVPFGSSLTLSNIADGPVAFSLKKGQAIILSRPFDFTGQ
jgi:thiamine pyrophosphokinase